MNVKIMIEYMGKTGVNKRWNAVVSAWFEQSPLFDRSGSVATCEKLFDLCRRLTVGLNNSNLNLIRI